MTSSRRVPRLLICSLLALCLSAAGADAAWCHWLSWTCDTSRTSRPPSSELNECRPRRSRHCCNSEPPSAADSSCGGSVPQFEWGGLSTPQLRCRSVVPGAGAILVPAGRPVNACATAYPRFLPSTLPAAWCPWDYWESWQYPTVSGSSCQRQRRRRCECGGRLAPATACPGFPGLGAETQVRSSASCSAWCAWSDWGLAASGLQQRRRFCGCAGAGSAGVACRAGDTQLANRTSSGSGALLANGTRIDSVGPSRLVIVSCLVLLFVGGSLLTALVLGLLLWKRALLRRARQQRTEVGLDVLPSAPSDAGAAAAAGASAKAAEAAFGRQPPQEPPPPYTSQPELRFWPQQQQPQQQQPQPMPPPY